MADDKVKDSKIGAENIIQDWVIEGYENPDEHTAMAMIYHAEQIRDVSKQLGRIADALESDQK